MSTDAARFNSGKARLSLVPTSMTYYTGMGLTYGEIKYNTHNWRKGFKWSSLIDSLMRHLEAFKEGEDIDAESGLPHLAMIGCNVAFLIEHYDKNLGEDDRFKAPPGQTLTFKMPEQRLGNVVTLDGPVNLKMTTWGKEQVSGGQ